MTYVIKIKRENKNVCPVHNKPAVDTCPTCGRPMCKECDTYGIFSQPADGTIYVCKKCYDQC